MRTRYQAHRSPVRVVVVGSGVWGQGDAAEVAKEHKAGGRGISTHRNHPHPTPPHRPLACFSTTPAPYCAAALSRASASLLATTYRSLQDAAAAASSLSNTYLEAGGVERWVVRQ